MPIPRLMCLSVKYRFRSLFPPLWPVLFSRLLLLKRHLTALTMVCVVFMGLVIDFAFLFTEDQASSETLARLKIQPSA